MSALPFLSSTKSPQRESRAAASSCCWGQRREHMHFFRTAFPPAKGIPDLKQFWEQLKGFSCQARAVLSQGCTLPWIIQNLVTAKFEFATWKDASESQRVLFLCPVTRYKTSLYVPACPQENTIVVTWVCGLVLARTIGTYRDSLYLYMHFRT